MRRPIWLSVFTLAWLVCGCQTNPPSTPPARSQSTVPKPAPTPTPPNPSAVRKPTGHTVAATSSKPPLMAGVIEGFYGSPWNTADTEDIITFIHAHGMNTFVYAPKDDPYQRQMWRQLYPANERAALQQLVQASNVAHVRFIASLSPGVDIQYSNPNDVRLTSI